MDSKNKENISQEGQVGHFLHMEAMLRRFAADPISPGSRLTLKDIYVSPQSLREEHFPGAEPNDPALVQDLLSSLAEDLQGEKPSSFLVSAPPGRGKTSAALALAFRVAGNGHGLAPPMDFLFYEFSDFIDICRDEISVLAGITPFVRDESFFFGKKTLVIVDGVTEENGPAFQDFVRNLCLLCRRVNKRKDGSVLRLLLFGRPCSVGAVADILIPPYVIHDIRQFGPEQANLWLSNWCRKSDATETLRLKDLARFGLSAFLGEPPMLFFCSLLASCQKGGLTAQEGGSSTRKTLHDIIRFTFRSHHELSQGAAQHVTEEQYLAFLRAAAFLMFRKNADELSQAALNEGLSANAGRYGLFALAMEGRQLAATGQNGGVTKLANRKFRFAHKSFQDCLATEAVFLLLAQSISQFQELFPERSFRRMAPEIYDILGDRPLTDPGYLTFIRDICKEEAKTMQGMLPGLTSFFSVCREHPYLVSCAREKPCNPLKAEANVLLGLICWMAEGARLANSKDPFFPEATDLFRVLCLYGAAYPLPGNNLSLDLSRLCMAGSFLARTNLRGIVLSGADLTNADLTNADLTGADLTGANLAGALMTGAVMP